MAREDSGRLVEFFVRWGRWAPWLALLLGLPALAGGIELDDVYFSTASSEPIEFMTSAFTIVSDGPRGAHFPASDLPWWSADGLQLDFFRPLAAVTHWIDRVLWPRQPWLMHAQSLLWYALLVALVRRVYLDLGGAPRTAGLAAFIFAACQAHAMNVGWVAARNSLLGTLGFVVALWLHHRARTGGSRAALVAGPLALALALLGNEGAVAGVGILVAYAAVRDGAPGRWTALIPHAVVVVAWRWAYRVLGYGALHSGMYLDPAADPGGYLASTVTHGVPMLAGALGLGILDPWASVPGGVMVLFALSIPFVAMVASVLRRLLRDDATTRMWATGMVLALVTTGAQVPTDRGLLLLSIATSPVVAALILESRRPDAGRGRRMMGGLLIGLHLIVSPLLVPVRVGSTGWVQGIVDRAYARMPGAAERRGDAILINAPTDLAMLYNRAIAEHRQEAFYRSFQWIYAGPGELVVERVSERALVVTSSNPWLAAPLDRGFRAAIDFAVGQRFERECISVTVEALDDQSRPTAVRLDIRESCEPKWLVWRDGGPIPFALPPVGDRAILPPAALR